MRLNVLIFDSIPVEGNDTFQSEIEAHGGPWSASIQLDPPRVDFSLGITEGTWHAETWLLSRMSWVTEKFWRKYEVFSAFVAII